MEPKAKTIIERHGFLDPDHKKPKHDEIQLWVYRNLSTVLTSAFPNASDIDAKILSRTQLEYPIVDRNFIVGFVDIYCPNFAAIEVKTEIPSIGELMRQIKFYKNYLSHPCWIVVSPDDRSASVLKEQGIYFYKYQRPGELF